MVCTTFPRRVTPLPPRMDDLAARGLSLRDAGEVDFPFLHALHASFRVDEMAFMPWSQAQKDAFLADQFRLQHHHFVSHFSGADFWVVERSERADVMSAVGRFYLDRSTPLWRVIDIGFAPDARGQGLGSALLSWTQVCAREAGAEASICTLPSSILARARSINTWGLRRRARRKAITSAWCGGLVDHGLSVPAETAFQAVDLLRRTTCDAVLTRCESRCCGSNGSRLGSPSW